MWINILGQYINIASKVILFYMLSQDVDSNAIFSCKDISTFLRKKLRKGFTRVFLFLVLDAGIYI